MTNGTNARTMALLFFQTNALFSASDGLKRLIRVKLKPQLAI